MNDWINSAPVVRIEPEEPEYQAEYADQGPLPTRSDEPMGVSSNDEVQAQKTVFTAHTLSSAKTTLKPREIIEDQKSTTAETKKVEMLNDVINDISTVPPKVRIRIRFVISDVF